MIPNPALLLCATRDGHVPGMTSGGVTRSQDGAINAPTSGFAGQGQKWSSFEADQVTSGNIFPMATEQRQSGNSDSIFLQETAKDIVNAAVTHAVNQYEGEQVVVQQQMSGPPWKPESLQRASAENDQRQSWNQEPPQKSSSQSLIGLASSKEMNMGPERPSDVGEIERAPSPLIAKDVTDAEVNPPLMKQPTSSGVLKNTESGASPGFPTAPPITGDATNCPASSCSAAKAEKIKEIFQMVAAELAEIVCSCQTAPTSAPAATASSSARTTASSAAVNEEFDRTLNRQVSFGRDVRGLSWEEVNREAKNPSGGGMVGNNRSRNSSGAMGENLEEDMIGGRRYDQNWNENATAFDSVGRIKKMDGDRRNAGKEGRKKDNATTRVRDSRQASARAAARDESRDTHVKESTKVEDENVTTEKERKLGIEEESQAEKADESQADEFFASLFDIYMKKMKKTEKEKLLDRGKNAGEEWRRR